MRELPAGRMLGLSGTLFVLFLAASGCNSVSPWSAHRSNDASSGNLAGNAKSVLVRPGMELAWTCKSPTDHPGMVRFGKSIVGPDGAVVLGPYGACPVAGMTLEQAGSRAEKQLAAYIKQPHVTLSPIAPVVPAAASGDIAWTRATPGAGLAQNSPSRQDAPIRRVGATQEAPPKELPMPRPVVTLKPNEETHTPHMVAGQPMSAKHVGKMHGPSGLPMGLPGAPSEGNKVRLEYRISPPDVLWINSLQALVTQPVAGNHTVRPDGTVGIGIYGAALVAGLTLDEAKPVIARVIFSRMAQKPYKDDKGNLVTPPTLEDVTKGLSVEVVGYNSSVYYVIMDAAGLGEQVYRFPITGNETVLDAISHIGGLQYFSSPKRIWVARRNLGHAGHESTLPVDWLGITRAGDMNTNWQVMPGDRVFVQADPMRKFNNNLGKFLEPIERILGATLLGSQTVNSIRGTNTSNR